MLMRIVTCNNLERVLISPGCQCFPAISRILLSVFYFDTDIVSFDRSEILGMIYTFISMDALYDDIVYQDMLVHNEFTIGRLIGGLFDCNLYDTMTCHKKKLPLLPVFTAVLLIIFIATVFVPIPTVVIVFLWTFGLVYGTAYLAYNFSPVCSPCNPTCLGKIPLAWASQRAQEASEGLVGLLGSVQGPLLKGSLRFCNAC